MAFRPPQPARPFPGSGGGHLLPSLMLNFLGSTALDSRITFARASTATDGKYTDAAGSSFNSFVTNAPRLSVTSGLLIEEQRTNSLLNSNAPVTQTTASLATGTYTLWVVGTGSATSSAGTATGSGFGAATAGTPNTFTLTVAGTVTVTVAGSLTRFQLENGGFPTNYIPTTAAAATRAGDTASLLNANWSNQVAGTLYCEFALEEALAALSGTSVLFGLSNGTFGVSDTYLSITSGGVTLKAPAGVGPAQQSAVTSPFIVNKVAGYYSATGNAVSLNGGVPAIASGGATPAAFVQAAIGQAPWIGGLNRANAYIRRILYWPRALSNSELQRVTT